MVRRVRVMRRVSGAEGEGNEEGEGGEREVCNDSSASGCDADGGAGDGGK